MRITILILLIFIQIDSFSQSIAEDLSITFINNRIEILKTTLTELELMFKSDSLTKYKEHDSFAIINNDRNFFAWDKNSDDILDGIEFYAEGFNVYGGIKKGMDFKNIKALFPEGIVGIDNENAYCIYYYTHNPKQKLALSFDFEIEDLNLYQSYPDSILLRFLNEKGKLDYVSVFNPD